MLAALAPAAAAARCSGSGARPGQVSPRKMGDATRCLVNRERARRGLRRLRENRRLSTAARRHARDMALRNYFSHRSLSGATFLDRIRRTGYLQGAGYWTVGENIAWGEGILASPREIVRAWMRSPGHRQNILARRFRQIGLGVSPGTPVPGRGGSTYVNTFGSRS
jgi:uncharacterized protein YkwD